MFSKLRLEKLPDFWIFILIFDLRPAFLYAAVDDVFEHFVFFAVPTNRQIAGFTSRSIEMLMKPLVRRRDDTIGLPIEAFGLGALRP